MKRERLSNWPSWLPRSSPCVVAGRGQWARARKLLARDEEASTTCVIVSKRGTVVGVVTLDGREAWVRGELVQPRRPGPGGWATQVKSYKQQTISHRSERWSSEAWQCTITLVGNQPITIQPHASDTGLPSPQGEVIDLNAGSTNVRVGSGWRKVRAKLRSGLMRFEDWGSV